MGVDGMETKERRQVKICWGIETAALDRLGVQIGAMSLSVGVLVAVFPFSKSSLCGRFGASFLLVVVNYMTK